MDKKTIEKELERIESYVFGEKTLEEARAFIDDLIVKYGKDIRIELESNNCSNCYCAEFIIKEVRQETDEEYELRISYHREQQKRDLENSRKRVAELERILGENK